MDFGLTSEQRQMFDTVRAFAIEHLAPHALEWDRTATLPRDTLREIAKLGMGGVCVPEENGGAGLTRIDSVLLFEALSYGCPAIAAFISIENLCAGMISAHAHKELRDRWLPKLIAMESLASYCLTEPGSGSDAAALATRATLDGNHYVLNGSKAFISGGGVSDVYVVMARTGGTGPKGISAIFVEKETPGVSFGANERKMGWNAQPTAQVIFDNCRVPTSNLLGDEGRGFSYALAGLDGGRLNIAACSLGAAQAALDKAIAYMHERIAFGQRLDQFQALQFRLADMETQLQAARAFLRQAAWKFEHKEPDATKFCAMAKRFVTDAAFAVANEALQLHGGYGYLQDFGVEKIVRDLRVHQILEGTNEVMRMIVARALLEEHGA
jgi:hypothetical protein